MKHLLTQTISSKFHLFISFFLLLHLSTRAQIIFEEGYIIDNDNKKTTCWIKNNEWNVSPRTITYQLNENSSPIEGDITDIKEFKVSSEKYRRFTVDIDQSETGIQNLSTSPDPEFKEETLFLKLLVEGKATLYVSRQHQKYFYSINNDSATQLIHKEYIAKTTVDTKTHNYNDTKNVIRSNDGYKFQLLKDLKCSDINIQSFNSLEYEKKDLSKLFEQYNKCVGATYTNYEESNNKAPLSLHIKAGAKYSTLKIRNDASYYHNVDFNAHYGLTLACQLEYSLAINKNKWSIFLEPSYQYYDSEDPRDEYSFNYVVDYSSIEIPLGIKYYMFLGEDSKLSLSTSFVVLDAVIDDAVGPHEITGGHNFNFSCGFSYKDKYSMELKYGARRDLLNSYINYNSNYQSLSVVLGYKLFGK